MMYSFIIGTLSKAKEKNVRSLMKAMDVESYKIDAGEAFINLNNDSIADYIHLREVIIGFCSYWHLSFKESQVHRF